MTIAEIESTLHTLLIRHPNLDEGMLVTLLTAGGWEDKLIKDAVALFKNLPPAKLEEFKKVDKILSPKIESVVVNTNNTQQTHQEDVFVDSKKNETVTNKQRTTTSITTSIPTISIPSVNKTPEVKLTEKPPLTPVNNPVVTAIKEVPVPIIPQKNEENVVLQKTPGINANVNINAPEEIVYIDSDGQEEDILPSFNNVVVKETLEPIIENKINIPVPVPVPAPTPIPEKILPKIDVMPVEVVPKPEVIIKEKEIPKIDTVEMVYFDGTGNEERELKNFVDDGKELPKVTEDLVIPKLEEKKKITTSQNSNDPQSLIVPKSEIKSIVPPPELPENLPMKPFESAPHVWPLSKYKEVFHGKVMPILSAKEQALVDEQKLKKEEIVKEESLELNQNHKQIDLKIKRTGFDGEDEGLILMTGVTLLIILLLLAYMYSNGRL